MRSWLSGRACWYSLAVALCACALVSCARQDRHAVRIGAEVTGRSTAEAKALWARNVAATEGTPIRAIATVTRHTTPNVGKPNQTTTVLDLLESRNGKYRLTYRSPSVARGRVVISDGKSVWQYEPKSNIVFKRSVNSDLQAMRDAQSAEDAWVREIEKRSVMLSGLSCDVLLLKGQNGSMVERRWIDRQTARTVRLEEYDDQGSVRRQVDLRDIAVSPRVGDKAFSPVFPGAHHLESAARLAPDVTREASRLGLPSAIGGMRLRSVITPRAREGTSEETHCVYTYGPRSISVFVSPAGSVAAQPVLVSGKDWRDVQLDNDVTVSAQEKDGRSAVSWIRERRHYVAVARMPLDQLLPAVGNLSR
ncbi:MAG: hypothetical protein WCL39_02680 [Armatimonadota bacterium]